MSPGAQSRNGTLLAYYMVKDDVWALAWPESRSRFADILPGAEYLCIGRLERRLVRALSKADFTNAPVNDQQATEVDTLAR